MRAHATRDQSAGTAADPRADDFASGTSPGSDADTLNGTREWPDDGITFSQFLRTQPDEFHPVFRLDLTSPQPSMLPTNTPSADPVTNTESGPLPVAAPRPLETRMPLQ